MQRKAREQALYCRNPVFTLAKIPTLPTNEEAERWLARCRNPVFTLAKIPTFTKTAIVT